MVVLKKLARAAALAGMLALPLAAFAADPIKMGAVNSYSGPMAPYGIEVARGHELAVDQLNAAGGVLGRKIEMIRGDATTPQQGIATVEQLVNKDKVDLNDRRLLRWRRRRGFPSWRSLRFNGSGRQPIGCDRPGGSGEPTEHQADHGKQAHGRRKGAPLRRGGFADDARAGCVEAFLFLGFA